MVAAGLRAKMAAEKVKMGATMKLHTRGKPLRVRVGIPWIKTERDSTAVFTVEDAKDLKAGLNLTHKGAKKVRARKGQVGAGVGRGRARKG